MKKPTFTAALAKEQKAEPEPPAKRKDDRINTTLRISPEGLEALKNVMSATDDVSGVEFDAGERHELDVMVNARDEKKSPVAFAHALPQEVVLAGVQAMRGKLEAML